MTRRLLRLSSLIRRVLAETIQYRLSDPRIAPFTSVTRVEVAADLSLATVYVSVMADGKPAAARLTLEALESAAGRLRSRLADALTVRRVPTLQFKLDESVRGAFETVQVIDALARERESYGPTEPPAPDAQPDESEEA